MQKSMARLGARPRILDGHPRIRKTLLWLVGIAVFIAVAGFLVAPPIVKWQAEKRLAALLHRTVAIERVSINPFALSAKIDGLQVSERDGSGAALRFDSLYARLSYETLVRFAPVVAEARLERPYLHLVRTPARAYNFQDLVDEFSARPAPQTQEPEEPARFSLNNLQLLDGRIEFDDQAEKQKHEVTGIHVDVPFVSNFESHVEVFVQPRLEAVVNGDPLRVTGETKPFHDSYETRVSLDLNDVDLPRYLDYSPVPLPFTLTSGKLEAALSATFQQAAKNSAQLLVSGNAAVREFALADAAGKPVLGFHQLGVVVNGLDVYGRKVNVARIGVEGPALDLQREKDGSLNLARLVPRPPAQGDSRPDGKAAAPFGFEIGEIAITSGKVMLADLVPDKPFRRQIEKLELRVRGLSSAENSRAGVEIGFESIASGNDTPSSGAVPARVDFAGEVQLAPTKVGGKLRVLQVRLGDLYPYYEAAINAEVVDGTADVSAALDISVDGGRPSGRVSGIAATLHKLRLKLPDSRAPFVEVESASLADGEADLAERRVTLGTIEIESPAYAIARDADGTLNATRLLKSAPAEAAPAQTSEPWVVTVKRLKLERGRAAFEDRSVRPSVKVALRNMTLTAEELSTVSDAQGRIAFRTAVNRAGSLSLQGKLSTALSGNLAITASRIDLVPFNPYLVPHTKVTKVGLASGKVSARGSLTLTGGNAMRAGYKGDLQISGIAVQKGAQGEELLTWESLRFAGIDADSEPLRVSIDDVALADFFARLVLDANGELNLSEIAQGASPGGMAPAVRRPPPQAESTATAKAMPQDARSRSAGARRPVDWLRVGRMRLQNGHVDFSDFFVRPNYRADLTELNGTISTLTFEQPTRAAPWRSAAA